VFAAIVDVSHVGYAALFALIAVESMGVPVPGETALITGAILASKGQLQIEWVIVLAATAAILGDNVGYLIGRHGGRRLLTMNGPFLATRQRVLRVGEPFFERHGPKAVFLGRFTAGLRIWAAWLAGATHMPWKSFLLYNALGGIVWATVVGVLAYVLGHAAEKAIEVAGVVGLVGAVVFVIGAFVVLRRRHAAQEERLEEEADAAEAAATSDPSL
jgi:membrane protein DedA with SNARE-associated domain